MKTKLTLNIDDVIIEDIKALSKKRKQSISAIVEDYLRKLTMGNEKKNPAPAETFTQRFRKTYPVSKSSLKEYDYKEEWHKHLEEKYGRK